jgi:type IV pilus assembly protein PilQ
VQLTQDVITNITREIETSEGVRTETVEVERTPAGLILDVLVDRIDDNGFVSLSVAPSISAPTATQTINVGLSGGGQTITLLAVRRVSSGLLRIRDGQTLILSGIIQDQDRATVTKVPLLGDIPILGALFRSTERRNERQEVIVLLTPQILDDSDTSAFGYRYVPQAETQEYIQQQNIQLP